MTHLTRRALGLIGAVALAGDAAAQPSSNAPSAQWAPARSIRLIAPYPPGGGVDTTSRLLAGPMGAFLGQPIVVENRAGAGGSIGAAEVARSAPDGLTILIDAMAHTVNPALLRGLPFDYATAFVPISLVVTFPSAVAVKNDFPARNLAEFVAAAKARPGVITVGTQGNATAGHLGLVAFARRAGIEVIHVPYRGGAAAAQDLASGAIDAVFTTLVSAGPVVDGGRARFLAIGTLTRVESRPEVPTIHESGHPGFDSNEWAGLFGPAATPGAVVAQMYDALAAAIAEPTIRARLVQIGCVPVASSPAAFSRFIREGRDAMASLVREANIRAE